MIIRALFNLTVKKLHKIIGRLSLSLSIVYTSALCHLLLHQSSKPSSILFLPLGLSTFTSCFHCSSCVPIVPMQTRPSPKQLFKTVLIILLCSKIFNLKFIVPKKYNNRERKRLNNNSLFRQMSNLNTFLNFVLKIRYK